MVGVARIELATSALSVLRSNRLSYTPACSFTLLHQCLDYSWTTTPGKLTGWRVAQGA